MKKIASFKFPFKETCLKLMKNVRKARYTNKLTMNFSSRHKFVPTPEDNIMSNFCSTTFIKTNGCLIPSSTKIGTIRKDGFQFGFNTILLAELFDRDFEKNHHSFLKTIFSNPQCIGFFELFKEVKGIRINKDDTDEIVTDLKNDREVDVQTILHPIPTFKDVNYMFSVWDLRRKGLQMANLTKCKTTSSQTTESFFRREAKIQTVDLVAAEAQTKKDEGENSHDYIGVNLPLDFRRPQ